MEERKCKKEQELVNVGFAKPPNLGVITRNSKKGFMNQDGGYLNQLMYNGFVQIATRVMILNHHHAKTLIPLVVIVQMIYSAGGGMSAVLLKFFFLSIRIILSIYAFKFNCTIS